MEKVYLVVIRNWEGVEAGWVGLNGEYSDSPVPMTWGKASTALLKWGGPMGDPSVTLEPYRAE